MHRAYRFAIAYFALFGVLLLLSGAVLFGTKIGLTPEAVSFYYLGNDIQPGKSAYGQLETAVPHLGAMGLFIMVLGHFLLFAPSKARRHAAKITLVLFAAAGLDIVSGFIIAAGYPAWGWVKLAAFFGLMLLGTALTLLILYYASWHSLSPRQHPR